MKISIWGDDGCLESEGVQAPDLAVGGFWPVVILSKNFMSYT